jgi:transposase
VCCHDVAGAARGQRGARTNKHGEECACCGTELTRSKGKKYNARNGPGRVCHSCYNDGADKPAAVAPVRPHSPLPLLTPEQQIHLRTVIKKHGKGKQGYTRSPSGMATAILHVQSRMEEQEERDEPPAARRRLSYHAVVKSVAQATVMGTATLRNGVKRFREEGELVPPPPKRISRDNPLHMEFGEGGPPIEVQAVICEKVKLAAAENRYISLSTLRADVYAIVGLSIPKTTMHRWMEEMGCEYGQKKLTGLQKEYAHALIRRYLLAYSDLLREYQLGRVILVWMDESYIHAGYCTRFSWNFKDDEGKVVKNRVRGCEKGKRLIIIHAMTHDGMLEQIEIEPSDNLTDKCESAGIVTAKLSAEGFEPEDYHDTLNGEKYLQWMRNRVFPAFQAKYRRKTMVLILDNAKYHHARGEDWVTPSKMSKVELGVFLRRVGVTQITNDEGRVFPSTKFTADASAAGGGPTAVALRKVVSDYVKSHPAINTTLVKQLMDQHKYKLLYTPPYESWLQPIELVWARVKHQVAMQSRTGRTWQETAAQTRTALHDITAGDCKDIIEHTHTLMDEWLKSDAAGSLKRYGSLEALCRLTKAQREQCTDLNLEGGDLVGDDIQQRENEPPRDGFQNEEGA